MSIATAIAEVRRSYAAFTRAAEVLHSELMVRAAAPDDGYASPLLVTVINTVAEHYHQSVYRLLCPVRTRELVLARHVGMSLCRECTSATVVAVGRAFKRDHGAVTHACHAIRNRCDTEPEFAREYAAIHLKVTHALQINHPHA